MKYKFKFEFKTGATSCLFAADETTRNKFGTCIDLSQLPIEPMLKKFAQDTNMKFQSLGLDETSDENFERSAAELLRRLRKNLGPDYQIE